MDTNPHFLVVNDSPHIQHVIVSLLKELGYVKVSEALDGQMALRAIKSAAAVANPVKFVITDCAMPFMDGLELIRFMRSVEEMHDIAILMVTEDANKENVLAANDAGANGYLVRPFNATNFKAKIDALMVEKGLKQPEVSLKSFRPEANMRNRR